MKNLLLTGLVLTLSMLAFQSTAQPEYRYGQFYEGYIINADGSRNEGFIRYGTMADNKGLVTFYKDKTNRKTKKKYKPKDIAGYKVGSEEYHSIRFGAILKQQVFARLEVNGHIKTYSVAEETEEGMTYVMALKKGDDDAVGASVFIRFAKQMSEYISDYEELSNKVKNKEKGYRLIHMEAIIAEYNKWYAENN